MKVVFIITARGGSKRLSRKNVMLFNGIPLIAHSINYAKSTLPNSPVYVSTDNEEITSISEEYGAQVINRPEYLASDTATSADVIKHAAEKIIQMGIEFDYMILLQPTNPLRPDNLVADAMSLCKTHQLYTLACYTESPLKYLKRNGERLLPVNYIYGQRSQDIDRLLFENGLLYVMSKDAALKGIIQNQDTYPLVINHPYGEVDIDTLNDFKKAEFIYKLCNEN